MWLSLALLLLFSGPSMASGLQSIHCQPAVEGRSTCEIRLEGTVEPGERLFLPVAEDADKLFFNEKLLGSTGYLLKYPVAVRFLPRLYSLQPLQGQVNPVLSLETTAFFPSDAAFPKAKIIPAGFPLRKAFLPLLARTFAFFLLLALSVFAVSYVRRATIDGWMYPSEELRWFFGSLCAFLLSRSDYTRIAVPGIWDASFHRYAENVSLYVALWCLSSLLLHVRFNDRACVERGLHRRPAPALQFLPTFALLINLCLLSFFPATSANWPLLVQCLPTLVCLHASIRSTEWKRVLKRSGPSPLFFHFSLLQFAAVSVVAPVLGLAMNGSVVNLVGTSAGLVLFFGALRMHRYFQARRRTRQLVKECRAALLPHARASDRLFALCDFIEDEWAAARVSVISVENSLGLVLASAGPEAIPNVTNSPARKLGPFLRRVCREGHILYAPVAEELGQDLQKEGLKHSSLGIPLYQQNKIRAVICMMADEGERIPAIDATMLEYFVAELSLEILSAAAQHVAEKKCEQLLSIAREADGLAVEHLDDWGYLHYAEKEESRFLVGATTDAFLSTHGRSPLQKTQAEFLKELKAIWHSLALAFEFVPREIKEDFWVVSPKEFRQPFLKTLGAEKVAAILASSLERHARALAAKESFLILAFPQAKVVVGPAKLQLVSYGAQENGAFEIDSRDFDRLRRLRELAGPAGAVILGSPAAAEDCHFRLNALGQEEDREYHSILAAFADKKEIRKIETKALETARESLRKAA